MSSSGVHYATVDTECGHRLLFASTHCPIPGDLLTCGRCLKPTRCVDGTRRRAVRPEVAPVGGGRHG